jgi:hypothetical protein
MDYFRMYVSCALAMSRSLASTSIFHLILFFEPLEAVFYKRHFNILFSPLAGRRGFEAGQNVPGKANTERPGGCE